MANIIVVISKLNILNSSVFIILKRKWNRKLMTEEYNIIKIYIYLAPLFSLLKIHMNF
jgi:hypothetical protein